MLFYYQAWTKTLKTYKKTYCGKKFLYCTKWINNGTVHLDSHPKSFPIGMGHRALPICGTYPAILGQNTLYTSSWDGKWVREWISLLRWGQLTNCIVIEWAYKDEDQWINITVLWLPLWSFCMFASMLSHNIYVNRLNMSRPPSPVPSFVSMKSGYSIHKPPNFSDSPHMDPLWVHSTLQLNEIVHR